MPLLFTNVRKMNGSTEHFGTCGLSDVMARSSVLDMSGTARRFLQQKTQLSKHGTAEQSRRQRRKQRSSTAKIANFSIVMSGTDRSSQRITDAENGATDARRIRMVIAIWGSVRSGIMAATEWFRCREAKNIERCLDELVRELDGGIYVCCDLGKKMGECPLIQRYMDERMSCRELLRQYQEDRKKWIVEVIPEDRTDKNSKLICPKCCGEIKRGMRFCPGCGARLSWYYVEKFHGNE